MGLYNTPIVVASMLSVFNTAPSEISLISETPITQEASTSTQETPPQDYEKVYQETLNKIEEIKKRRAAAPAIENYQGQQAPQLPPNYSFNSPKREGLLSDIPQEKIDNFMKISQCESGGDWSINTGNGFYGGLQFLHQTWISFGGQEFSQYANQATMEQQIYVADKVQNSQGWKAWPACTAKLGIR